MVAEDTQLTNCNGCGENISKGGRPQKPTTQKSNHPDKFQEYTKLMEATKEALSTKGKEATSTKQLTLVESTERSRK